MLTTSLLFKLRLCFFLIAAGLNIALVVLLSRHEVEHSDIYWWLFSLQTIGLCYYSAVEIWMDRFLQGRLSILGLIGSAVAAQGVLSSIAGPALSTVLMLAAGCNLGFVFAIGLRIKETPPPSVTEPRREKAEETSNNPSTEITPHVESPAEHSIPHDYSSDASSDTSTDSASSAIPCPFPTDKISLLLGALGLMLGVAGWALNFSVWIKECTDKHTCSELRPQWWSLSQSMLFFVMFILAQIFSRSFEILAAYSVIVSIPVSIHIRVANSARSDFIFLEDQTEAHQTYDSLGTVLGSSLLAASGMTLVISLGLSHFSWKTPTPAYAQPFRAMLSLFGLVGLVIFGIGLRSAQDDVCSNHQSICHWYDGLWVDISLEIVIVIAGILSVFGQPGEGTRALLVALAVLPSYTYIFTISKFLHRWNSHDSFADAQWDLRLSACGLIALSTVNYLWILSWGWGMSECSDRYLSEKLSDASRTLLRSRSSI